MRRVYEFPPMSGVVLAEDVHLRKGGRDVLLLRAGTRLSTRQAQALKHLGVKSIKGHVLKD